MPLQDNAARSFDIEGQQVYVYVEQFHQDVIPDYDEAEWSSVGSACKDERSKLREQARWLARKHPNIKRVFALYDMYVLGNELIAYMEPDLPPDPDEDEKTIKHFDDVKFYSAKRWRQFLEFIQLSWSPRELAHRTWRDGESFTRIMSTEWPPDFAFLDPEDITDNGGDCESEGIETEPGRVTHPKHYYFWDRSAGKLGDTIDADEVIHNKIDVDSNEKRGRTRCESIIPTALMLMGMVRNESAHRNAQTSIVLVRKVAGTKLNASTVADNAQTGTANYGDTGPMRKEKWRPGTVLTTSKNVEVEFKQPQSNFSDASPLLKMLLQQISAATGWSYSQLTADPSDGNFASALVAESPVYQMVQTERKTLSDTLKRVVKIVFESAVADGKIPGVTGTDDLWEDWKITIEYGEIVSRDDLKSMQGANIAAMQRGISRAEVARRAGADPIRMKREIRQEMEEDVQLMGVTQVANPTADRNPSVDDMKKSSADNASAGGTNQGDAKPAGHDDALA
jgi:capsid protein